MNLFDRLNETYGKINARRLEKQAREQEQQPGAVAARYNPTLGARDITTADGGTIGGARSITGAGVGQDTPVQITPNGKGAIYDFKNPKSSGDLVSANSAQERGGKIGSGGLGGAGTGAGGDTGPVTGYVPQPDGTCSVVVATSLSQLPPGAFATAQECLDSNREGDWVCQGGQCVAAPKGTGRWKRKAECEAALIPVNFEGGQCAVAYRLTRITVNRWIGPACQLTTNTYYYPTGSGPVIAGPITSIRTLEDGSPTFCGVNPLRPTSNTLEIRNASGAVTAGLPTTAFPQIYQITGATFERVDGQPDNCGNPPKICPV